MELAGYPGNGMIAAALGATVWTYGYWRADHKAKQWPTRSCFHRRSLEYSFQLPRPFGFGYGFPSGDGICPRGRRRYGLSRHGADAIFLPYWQGSRGFMSALTTSGTSSAARCLARLADIGRCGRGFHDLKVGDPLIMDVRVDSRRNLGIGGAVILLASRARDRSPQDYRCLRCRGRTYSTGSGGFRHPFSAAPLTRRMVAE